ncbi:hypothetical protein BAE46_01015 [Glaciecola punicea]|jgi:hypothetical protein|nr:hypothetical protein BAE46_01015 [Glaciecola punicea]
MRADPVDQSSDNVANYIKHKVRSIRNKKRELNPSGACRWCLEPFEDPKSQKLFCDTDCSSDFEKSNRK